jgi:hypothetical protein
MNSNMIRIALFSAALAGCGANAPPTVASLGTCGTACRNPCYAPCGPDGSTPEDFYAGDSTVVLDRMLRGSCAFPCSYVTARLSHPDENVRKVSVVVADALGCPPEVPEVCRVPHPPDFGRHARCISSWRELVVDEIDCLESHAGDAPSAVETERRFETFYAAFDPAATAESRSIEASCFRPG